MRFVLSRKARLFDSWNYIIKSFLAIFVGYFFFHRHPIIKKDMISLLFGIMLTLEPVSFTGIKSGIEQVKSTIIGGTLSAVVIYFFGINYFTVPFVVGLVIYVTLTLDWRNISIIGIFTAIYMTQYIQLDALGKPSVLLTFRLRIVSVIVGVFIAIVFNYIFSKLFYKQLVRRRTIFILEAFEENLEEFEKESIKHQITTLFNDIDFILENIKALKVETKNKEFLKQYETVMEQMRVLNHHLMDLKIEKVKLSKETKNNLGKIIVAIKNYIEKDESLELIDLTTYKNEKIRKMVKVLDSVIFSLKK